MLWRTPFRISSPPFSSIYHYLSLYLQSLGAVWRLVSVVCGWVADLGVLTSGFRVGDGKDGAVDGRKEKAKIRFFGVGTAEGSEDTTALSTCTVTWTSVSDCALETGEVYASEDTHPSEAAVGSREIIGSWPNPPGSRWVGESYSNILSTNTHLRPAMQRQRLTRQARMGTMQIFSELRQPRRRSASRQTQQGTARPTSPELLPSSVWLSGMSSAAGSPSRDGSVLSWVEGLEHLSAVAPDMSGEEISIGSPPEGLASLTVHYHAEAPPTKWYSILQGEIDKSSKSKAIIKSKRSLGERKGKKASSNYQIKVYGNSLLLFLGHFGSSFKCFSKPSPLVKRTAVRIETELMVGQLSKPVAQTERHVSHLEHLKLVSA